MAESAVRRRVIASGRVQGVFFRDATREEAARIEAEEVRRHLDAGSALERVVFAVRGEAARAAFEAALSP